MSEPVKMKRGLKNRHLQMIALGGAIGTGLFYGSASTIALAGPAVILSYLLGGIVIFFIMRMLGEMAVDEPVSGSFSHYATKYWGRFAGFVSGWNYWFNYVLVSMAELTAVGIYVHYWLPDVPQWLSALVCLVVITAVNLINVRAYGEFEFWMALIKITAIVLMIVLGLYLLGIAPQPFPENFSNLWANGGFLPNGWWGMGLATAVVMFSFGGIELIGITAGEAENPDRTIPRAINQVIWRILIFYVGTMIVLMALWPWNKVGMEASPFVQIFENVGIPAAAHILNFVVLTAAISVYNSAIYSNSRMLYGLAKKGEAPQIFTRLSARGVPVIGILVSSGCTLVVVALNYFLEGHVFMYLCGRYQLGRHLHHASEVPRSLRRPAQGHQVQGPALSGRELPLPRLPRGRHLLHGTDSRHAAGRHLPAHLAHRAGHRLPALQKKSAAGLIPAAEYSSV